MQIVFLVENLAEPLSWFQLVWKENACVLPLASRSRQSAVALALCPLQLAALNGREEARGAARRSETIRIPVGVDRLQSSASPGRSPPSG